MSWNFDEHVSREGTYSFKYDLRHEFFGSKDIIPMWVADMDFRTPDFITEALKKRLDNHQIYGYSFRPPEYYTSIIDWVKTRHNWDISRDWICFSPGVVPALNFCTLAFTAPGDAILVQPPVYFPFFSATEAHGRRLIHNQLKEADGKWEMDFDHLESLTDQGLKMIFLSNPHNPVGRAWTRDELQRLADFCLRRKIIIVSDEIHSDLVLPGHTHVPVASLSKDISAITVTMMAPSKTFNLAGLATSSVIIEDPVLRNSFTRVTENLHIGSGNLFGIIASVAAYSNGHKWLDELLKYIQENVNIVKDYLAQHLPQIVPVHPEATYMIWLDCRKMGLNGKELQNFFVKKAGVGLNEGSVFGPGGEGFMRMNLGTTKDIVKKALVQINKAFTE